MDVIVFYAQFIVSVLVYFLLAKWFVLPKLAAQSKSEALLLLMIPQAFRHLGLYGLAQAAFDPSLPEAWARPVAVGDMATQISAVIAMVTLRQGGTSGIAWAWICTVVGTLDFIVSSVLTHTLDVPVHSLGAAWFLAVFFLPVVVLSHWYSFRLLLSGSVQSQPLAATASGSR